MLNFKVFSEDYFDEAEAFYEMKGWRNDLWIYFDDKYYKLEFETIDSLNIRINAHIKANNWALLNPYVIVIEDLSMSNILRVINNLLINNFLNSYIPIEQKDGLIEILSIE